MPLLYFSTYVITLLWFVVNFIMEPIAGFSRTENWGRNENIRSVLLCNQFHFQLISQRVLLYGKRSSHSSNQFPQTDQWAHKQIFYLLHTLVDTIMPYHLYIFQITEY